VKDLNYSLPVYLDYCATSPLGKAALDAMLPFMTGTFGNPSSENLHGQKARSFVYQCRAEILEALGIKRGRVIFTSGATESNNLALMGTMKSYASLGKHFITTAIEHPSVLQAVEALEQEGFYCKRLEPDSKGQISVDALAAVIREDTILVSVQLVNHITGIRQDLKSLGEFLRNKGILFHVDATQAPGRMSLDFSEMHFDMMSFSAHKFHGPTGCGALIIKEDNHEEFDLTPIIYGGGQQSGIRPGSLNVSGIAGLHAALLESISVSSQWFPIYRDWEQILRSRLRRFDNIVWIGDDKNRVPGHFCFCVPGIDTAKMQQSLLKEISFATSSACGAGKNEPSPVLKSMGYSDEVAFSPVRISLGKQNTTEEIEFAGEAFYECIKVFLKKRK
jgi:cysteine desulfurase